MIINYSTGTLVLLKLAVRHCSTEFLGFLQQLQQVSSPAVMLAKQSIITPEIVRERQDRHRRLMRMIKNYKRTNQEVRKLEKIKDNTVLEINLRHLRSEHNRTYKFPKDCSSSDDESNLPTDNPFLSQQTKMYDLRAQNQIQEPRQRNVSHENGRRVKSLNQQKNGLEEQRLGRFQETKKQLQSYKNIRKKSLIEKKRVYSTIKLPQLLKREKMKTENKNDSFQLQKIVGKKLATQSTTPKQKPGIYQYIESQRNKSSQKKLESHRKLQIQKKVP